jgi:Spy/CpxP family protein refolding chaperone
MKKIFVACCLLMFAFMVSAQQGGQRRQMTPEQLEQRYEQMKKDLNLTDKQLGEIKKIEANFRTKMQEVREKAGGDREKMREEMTKLRNEQNAKVKPLLKEDQYTKYVEMNQFRGRPGGGGGN